MGNNLGNKETMARNIKHYMEKNNVNSVEMCRILNVPQSTFSYWLNARTYPRIDKIEKMAAYFGIPKSFLVEEHIPGLVKEPLSKWTDADMRLLMWFRSLPPEKQRAILIAQDAPEDVISDQDHE